MNRRDVTVIVVVTLLAIIIGWTASAPHTVIKTDATFSASGEFDRVALDDRHLGNWNGIEVEGVLLASLDSSGTVSIIEKHYEGSFTRTYMNFCFFLYVYADEDHLREKISVMGGDTEKYEYLNITITVSLATKEVSIERNLRVMITIGGCFAALAFVLYYMGRDVF